MEMLQLGKTDLRVSRTAFGALPIQRVSPKVSTAILRRAFEGGINYFDTARMYTDSEEKIGFALKRVRQSIIIATKTHAKNAREFWQHLEQSLRDLQTDYIDVYQFHLARKVHRPGEEDGLYDAMEEARRQGKVRFAGLTAHSLDVALKATASGLYCTVQFPLNHLSSERDLSLIGLGEKHHVGIVAMKGMSGGLITNPALPFTFLRQFSNVVPIWGIQHLWELEEFLALEASPPKLDSAMEQEIAKDCRELKGNFCRSCGYCLPCPKGIEIPQAARMEFLLKRMPWQTYMSAEWKTKMERVRTCIHCDACKNRCPYSLDTPALLERNLAYYESFYAEHIKELF